MSLNRLLYVGALTGGAAALAGWLVSRFAFSEQLPAGPLGLTWISGFLGAALGAGYALFSSKRRAKSVASMRAPAGTAVAKSAPSRPANPDPGAPSGQPNGPAASPAPRAPEPTRSYHLEEGLPTPLAEGSPLPLPYTRRTDSYLLAINGPQANKSYPLELDQLVLGRGTHCDLVLTADAVSREHACIMRIEDEFFIEDLKSRNGTYVNDRRITERTPLNDNDRIRICDLFFTYHDLTASGFRAPCCNDSAVAGALSTVDDALVAQAIPIMASLSSSSHHFLKSNQREKLRAMVEMSMILSQSLEPDDLMAKVVESLFQLFKHSDRCFILLREAHTEGDRSKEELIPKVIKTRQGHDETPSGYSRALVRECLKSVQALLRDDVLPNRRPNASQNDVEYRVRSVMCAPLFSLDDKAFGVIQLDTQERSKKFTEDDLGTLVVVATLISVALEKARLPQSAPTPEKPTRDMQLAREVQQALLPRELPKTPGYEFYAFYEAAQEIGGDYYGFLPLPDLDKLAILLGDVAGKGTPAALLMAKLSSDARYSLQDEANPATAIRMLNNLVHPHTTQMDRFVTLVMALLDPQAHRITLVNAGHPPPLIYRKAQGILERSNTAIAGLPLGITVDYPYEQTEIDLHPGDFVVLFSDGVTDPFDRDGNQVNEKALQAALAGGGTTPASFGEKAIHFLKQFTLGSPPYDDITLVCFGRC